MGWLYQAMLAAAPSQASWEIEAAARIFGDRRRLAVLLLLCLPLALPALAPALVAAAGPLPDTIGGKSAFGPSFHSPQMLLGSLNH